MIHPIGQRRKMKENETKKHTHEYKFNKINKNGIYIERESEREKEEVLIIDKAVTLSTECI